MWLIRFFSSLLPLALGFAPFFFSIPCWCHRFSMSIRMLRSSSSKPSKEAPNTSPNSVSVSNTHSESKEEEFLGPYVIGCADSTSSEQGTAMAKGATSRGPSSSPLQINSPSLSVGTGSSQTTDTSSSSPTSSRQTSNPS